jgi:hypothetical protein
MEQGNIQSIHVARLVSAFHSAVNPIDVIVSFQNAGIMSRLGPDGLAIWHVDIDQCRYLLNSVEVTPAMTPDGGRQDIGNSPTNMEAVEDVDVP